VTDTKPPISDQEQLQNITNT